MYTNSCLLESATQLGLEEKWHEIKQINSLCKSIIFNGATATVAWQAVKTTMKMVKNDVDGIRKYKIFIYLPKWNAISCRHLNWSRRVRFRLYLHNHKSLFMKSINDKTTRFKRMLKKTTHQVQQEMHKFHFSSDEISHCFRNGWSLSENGHKDKSLIISYIYLHFKLLSLLHTLREDHNELKSWKIYNF